ncbi:MAG: hypothetical protein JNK14_12740 [Chitinophagaceae bacterium]|nr:hypothetical protein [Chitinophagaceae bacterium]
MKRILITAIVLFSMLAANAQTDTTKVEQYCQVIAAPGLLSNRVSITIDFGEERSFWRDNRLKTEAGKIKRFNTIVDALNYMGREGWIFMNAFPVRMGETDRYHFAFKKLFPRTEMQQ